MELGLKNKVVVITGGATGIGKSTAREFAKEGAKVAILGRRQEKLDEAVKEFEALGFSLFARSVDVTDYDALAAYADEVEKELGPIYCWINNAGSNHIESWLDYDAAGYRKMIEVLQVAVFSGTKIAALKMKQHGGGVIINASSYASVIPNAGRGPYSACKAAVSSMTRTFAAELAADNIRVLSYIPGMIATEISAENRAKNGGALLQSIPLRRFGDPDDLGKVICFMASDACNYMTGTEVQISGGKFCVQNNQYAYGH